MLFLSLLLLAGGVLAQPTVYVRSSLAYPWTYFYPPVAIADVEAKVPGIPEAPLLEPLSLVKAITLEDPEDRKVDVIVAEAKEEEVKEEEGKEEEGKEEEEGEGNHEEELKEEEEKPEDRPGEAKIEKVVLAPEIPIKLVKWEVPDWMHNFWTSLPISLPHIDYPFTFPAVFPKPPPPPTPTEPEPVVETIRSDPSFISPSYIRVVTTK